MRDIVQYTLTHKISFDGPLYSCVYRFEQWILRVVVNNTPRPISNDSAAVIERQRIQVSFALHVSILLF